MPALTSLFQKRTMACTGLAVSYFVGTFPGFHHLAVHWLQTATTKFAGTELVDVHEQTPAPQFAAQPLLENGLRTAHVVQRGVSIGYQGIALVGVVLGGCDIDDHLLHALLVLHERVPPAPPHPSFVNVKVQEEWEITEDLGDAETVGVR